MPPPIRELYFKTYHSLGELYPEIRIARVSIYIRRTFTIFLGPECIQKLFLMFFTYLRGGSRFSGLLLSRTINISCLSNCYRLCELKIWPKRICWSVRSKEAL